MVDRPSTQIKRGDHIVGFQRGVGDFVAKVSRVTADVVFYELEHQVKVNDVVFAGPKGIAEDILIGMRQMDDKRQKETRALWQRLVEGRRELIAEATTKVRAK